MGHRGFAGPLIILISNFWLRLINICFLFVERSDHMLSYVPAVTCFNITWICVQLSFLSLDLCRLGHKAILKYKPWKLHSRSDCIHDSAWCPNLWNITITASCLGLRNHLIPSYWLIYQQQSCSIFQITSSCVVRLQEYTVMPFLHCQTLEHLIFLDRYMALQYGAFTPIPFFPLRRGHL